jgi:DNA-binding beta-propeller fold protein YncE
MQGKRMMIRKAALAAILLVAVGAGSASAKDRVYWVNRAVSGTPSISYTSLDGSGGGHDIAVTGATLSGPFGLALDPAHGRIYWANVVGNKISYANLDGSGGGHDLNTTGTTVAGPVGLALDAADGRIYWANANNNTISYARLDGSGGDTLPTTSAVPNEPFGVAVDPTAGRLYWANAGNNTISFANLDGSGGGNLNTAPVVPNHPTGLAVDPVGRRIYWANFSGNTISYANLTGGGGNLNTTGTSIGGPEGVALDVAAGRLYWGNAGTNKLSFTSLDAVHGGGDLPTTGASTNWSTFPVVLKAPVSTGAPTASGGSTVGSSLSCTPGSFASDLLPEQFYRAAQTISYQWTVNGAAVAGAVGSTVVANAAGDWRCIVTAANAAGSSSQTTNAVTVIGDTDHDGILDNVDKCPTVPAGKFDRDHNGCPGPYQRLRLSTLGTWSVFPKGVQIGSMSVKGLHKGVKVKLSCRACHVSQTLTAKGSSLSLKKLKRKLIRRGKSFTLTATGLGYIGDRLTLTVKRYGHKHKDLVRAARNPFTKKHACLPVGSSKTAKSCSTTPPTGP